ncbi:MAG: 1-deoxy-D-xylulose-5-phosphate synthase [Oscillospiraceae bacterium]|nr:1-deoxy-D-xylulose-5-phosphate synthase [Oscillospiraceae bacterium]
MLLEKIYESADVKRLHNEQLNTLCEELRAFLVEQVSHTGGHLASNLGVVELTVAIHRVFDTRRDRLVFDVGHQCYVHKALTGRQELFPTLRRFGGISGFPKPSESEDDAFVAGHASNSVSVALGMARARTMLHDDYHVLALIGDGALTGGLAYEGLNNAGASGEPMIVILNDNGMSIKRNVGAMSKHLTSLRTKPKYYSFKRSYRDTLSKMKGGKLLYDASHALKTQMKKALLPNATMFEDMGFTYLGPVDGHDVDTLVHTLEWAKEIKGPVLVHVNTVKGRGYAPAEREPDKFHGVGPFDASTGKLPPPKEDFSAAFGAALTELAGEDARICAITAAMEEGTGLGSFAEKYPERFFDVGIAESHATAMAAGLAKQGALPVFAVYSSFLQRSYDQLLHDVALSRLHVVFGVDRAGLVGADGATHHGTFDTVFLPSVPGMRVFCPSNYAELRSMLRRAIYDFTGPVAIRYPRGGEGAYKEESGKRNLVELRPGRDITLCTYGTMINSVLEAAELLAERNISARVVKINCINPLFGAELCECFGATERLVVVEESAGVGCIGQRIEAILAEHGCAPCKLLLLNLGRSFAVQGNLDELYREYGLDALSLANRAQEVCREQ